MERQRRRAGGGLAKHGVTRQAADLAWQQIVKATTSGCGDALVRSPPGAPAAPGGLTSCFVAVAAAGLASARCPLLRCPPPSPAPIPAGVTSFAGHVSGSFPPGRIAQVGFQVTGRGASRQATCRQHRRQPAAGCTLHAAAAAQLIACCRHALHQCMLPSDWLLQVAGWRAAGAHPAVFKSMPGGLHARHSLPHIRRVLRRCLLTSRGKVLGPGKGLRFSQNGMRGKGAGWHAGRSMVLHTSRVRLSPPQQACLLHHALPAQAAPRRRWASS